MTTNPNVKPIALLSASIVGATAALVFNIFPLFISQIAGHFDFDNQQAGFIGTAFLGAFAIVTLLANLWVPKAPWKGAILTSFVVILLSLLGLKFVQNANVAFVFIATLGLASGVNFTIPTVILSRYRDPDRAFGIKLTVEMSLAAIVMIGMTKLIVDQFGFNGFIVGMSATYLLLALATMGIPAYSAPSLVGGDDKLSKKIWPQLLSTRALPVWLMSAALFVQFGTLAALWGFAEAIATNAGIEAKDVGSMLSLAVVAGIFGAFVVAVIGNKFGTVKPLTLGFLAIIAVVLWMYRDAGSNTILIFVCVISASIQYTAAYLMGSIAEVDVREKFTTMIPFILASSGAIGPGIAGSMIESSGNFQSLYKLAIVMTILSFVLTVTAKRISHTFSAQIPPISTN